jgi:hypothetical protein
MFWGRVQYRGRVHVQRVFRLEELFMKRAVWISAATMLVVAACTNPDAAPTAPNIGTVVSPTLDVTVPDAGMPGEVAAHVQLIRGLDRGAAGHQGGPFGGGGGGSPNLINHGGPVLTGAAEVQAVYWGTSWSPSDPKIDGLASFLKGIGGSSYANTNTEYIGSNGRVTSAVTYLGDAVDNSATPRRAPSVSQIVGEVCKVTNNDPHAGAFYAVFTDMKRGHNGYCAWHSYGSCGGTPVEVAFFFDLDGDSGCDPQDIYTGHSQGLSALANVLGHELSEALTDPNLNAWYDNNGAENADKCAWTFNGVETFTGGSKWYIQGNWSNAAYNNNKSGYANGGCINGNP